MLMPNAGAIAAQIAAAADTTRPENTDILVPLQQPVAQQTMPAHKSAAPASRAEASAEEQGRGGSGSAESLKLLVLGPLRPLSDPTHSRDITKSSNPVLVHLRGLQVRMSKHTHACTGVV